MPARRAGVATLCAGLAACVSATPPSEPVNPRVADRIDRAVADGDASGYPDLSAIPEPAERPSAGDLAADADALGREAAALRTLRAAAAAPPETAELERRGAALRRDVDRARAAIDAAPEIDVPDDLAPPR